MKNHVFSTLTICITLALLFVQSSLELMAVPAYPGPIDFKQPDGSIITISLVGDEYIHKATTIDGYTLMLNSEGAYEYAQLNKDQALEPSGIIAKNSQMRSSNEQAFLKEINKGIFYSPSQLNTMRSIKRIRESESERQRAFPTTGTRKLICILMGFKDLSFKKSQGDFQNLFNQVGYNVDGATGSVKDYYKENSHGKLNLSVTVAGPYKASQNMKYYGASNGNPRALVKEAVTKANASVNYANFDNDNDGSVDGVYIIFAGYGEEAGASADAIWSHAWSIPTVTLDGKRISRYSCSPELRGKSGSGITRIGVICHEFGHVLGAPDYYDTDYATGGQYSGTGSWDLMAGGAWNNGGSTPAHHNVYTKTQLYKWFTAKELTSTQNITMSDVVTSKNHFYKIKTKTSGEYFLLENRQKKGFDNKIPGHGLMIYHVHKDVANVGNKINVTYPQKMYPVCANASSNPSSNAGSYGNINSSNCPFPGGSNKKSFTDATTPNAKSWNGTKTNMPITNIVENGDKISFKISKNQGSSVQKEFYFDLGTASSLVFPNYTRITNTTKTNDYGWTNTSGLGSRDRGNQAGVNALNRDIIFSSQEKTFEVKVPNGNYKVLVTIGDFCCFHDKINVYAEGTHFVRNFTAQKNKFINKSTNVYVNDGKLTLKFSDNGGTDANWVATRIVITPASANTNNVAYKGTVRNIPGNIEAEDYNVGENGKAYSDNSNGNTGGKYRSNDVDIESRDGGYSIGWTAPGEWLDYSVNSESGKYTISARVATPQSGKKINVKLDGNLLATITAPNTGGWGNFSTVSVNNITIPQSNEKNLRIEFENGGLNLNWVKFEKNSQNAELVSENVSSLTDNSEINIESEQLVIYPNPSNGTLFIDFENSKGIKNLNIFDLAGRIVYTNNNVNDQLIEVNNLKSGIYSIIATGDSKTYSKKLIVE